MNAQKSRARPRRAMAGLAKSALVPGILAAYSPLLAQVRTTHWENAAGGDFFEPANWSDGVPAAGDTAHITKPGAYTVSITNAAAESARAYVGGENADITLDLAGGSYTVTNYFNATGANNAPNRLTVLNGSLDLGVGNNNNVMFGNGSSNNEFIFSGANVTTRGAGAEYRVLFAHASGNNRLILTNQTRWVSDNPGRNGDWAQFRFAGASGGAMSTNNFLHVSGQGTKAHFTDNCRFIMDAVTSNNTLLVNDGASMVCSNRVYFLNSPANNTVRITDPGTRFEVYSPDGGPLLRFQGMNNTLRIDNGAHAYFNRSTSDDVIQIGDGGQSRGCTLQVDSGATMELGPPDSAGLKRVTIGGNGRNNTWILDNANFISTNNAQIIIGDTNDTSVSNRFILRNKAVLNNLGSGSLYVGNNSSTFNTMLVTGNSVVTNNGSFFVGNGPNTEDPAKFRYNQGHCAISNNAAVCIGNAGITGVGVGKGSFDNLLEVVDGGQLVCNNILSIGRNGFTGRNTLRVADTGSLAHFWNGQFYVGEGGGTCSNNLEVLRGGITRIETALNIGQNNTFANAVLVSGPNSKIIAGNVNVGNQGVLSRENRLTLANRGELEMTATSLTVGNGNGSNNVLKIHNGILSANANVNLTVRPVNRVEIEGAQSDILIGKATFNAGATLEFTLGKDGIAPMILSGQREIDAAALLKVNVGRGVEGMHTLLTNRVAVAAGTQQFQAYNITAPSHCEIIQNDSGIFARVHASGTLFILK